MWWLTGRLLRNGTKTSPFGYGGRRVTPSIKQVLIIRYLAPRPTPRPTPRSSGCQNPSQTICLVEAPKVTSDNHLPTCFPPLNGSSPPFLLGQRHGISQIGIT